METAPAKVSAVSAYLVASAANTLVERFGGGDDVGATETTTSTSYTDLTTAGPAITRTTGVEALIGITMFVSNNTAGAESRASFAVSGATTDAASDIRAFRYESSAANDGIATSYVYLHEGLTGGSNTFTLKYRVTAGTGTFSSRKIWVLPF